MIPPRRQGFMGEITPSLGPQMNLAHYATFLGANVPAIVRFTHASDDFMENRPLAIRSIERNEYPNPQILRGTLQIDCNRPGQDAGDDPIDVDVVVEIWQYPKTLVYSADSYTPITWSVVEDVPERAVFQYKGQNYIKNQNGIEPVDYAIELQVWVRAVVPNTEFPKPHDVVRLIETVDKRKAPRVN